MTMTRLSTALRRPLRPLRSVLTAILILGLGATVAPAAAQASAAVYYVDCAAGDDQRLGTSASEAWRTLAKVNARSLAAGDQVLFKRGVTCSGSLFPRGSGVAGSPIALGAYGSGALPVIDAGSTSQYAVKLFNQQYWSIRDLELRGGTRYGLFVSGDTVGFLNHFRVTNLVVRDVLRPSGEAMSSKDTGLVVFTPGVEGNKFNDVVIDGVTAYNTTQWSGILVGKGTGADAWAPNAANRSTNVTVRNSTVHDVYGDGIILFIVNSGLLENNVAYRTGLEPTQSIGTPNGIWTWACKDCVVQNNEAYQNFTPGTIDGGGFDIDYFTENNTVQFNYAHDNEGYCFATYSRTSSPTRNAVFRYNLCANNGQGLGAQGEIRVYADSGFDGVQIYNNTVYANLSADAAAIQNNGSFSGSRPNFIKNNIVYSTRPKLISSNTAMALNNNLYWYTGTGNPTWRYNSVDYTSIASYRTGSAQESASLYKNPRLNQPTSHPTGRPATAYTLLPDSPAINAGADVCAGLTGCSAGSRDYYGNAAPAGGAYDIGAYEGPGVDGPVDPLLTNGGFESASAGQWNLRGTTSIVSGNASSGQKALSVAGTTAGAYITLGGLSPDTTYTFAGQLKSSTSGSKAYLYAKSFGRTDVRSLLHDNVNYTPTSISFTTGPSATSAEIGVWRDSVHGSGTVYADEFTLKPNLVTNPGFESNSLSPWTVQNATIGSDARTGSRALSVGGSSAGAWHKVSGLSPNTTYTFRAHLKSQAASDGAYLYAKNFGGTEVRSSTYTGTAYGPVTVTFTTGSSQYSAEVGIWRGSGMGTGSVSADDFELF